MTYFLIRLAIFLFFALPSSIWDIKKMHYPIALPIIGSFVFFGFYLFFGLDFMNAIYCGLCNLALLTFTRYVTEGSLGKGDIIFGFFTGMYCKLPYGVFSLIVSALLGLFFYLYFYVSKRKTENGTIYKPIFAIPFIPFMTAGAVLTDTIIIFLRVW